MRFFARNLMKLDIILLIAFPIIAVFFSRLFFVNTLVSIILFYLPLATYLSFRKPRAILKTIIFSALITVGFGIVFDYPAYLDKAWHTSSMFSHRIYGLIAWEDLIWAFSFVYTVVIFYEHFIDTREHRILEGRAKYGIALLIFFLVLFFSLFYFKPNFLYVEYYYFWFGFIFILLPVIGILSYYHKLIPGFFITGGYFFAHSLVFELTALQLNQWSFPGEHYIGWITLGHFTVPFEEFFFFAMVSAMGVLAYFEFFDVEKN